MPSSNLVNYLIPDHYIQRQYDSVGFAHPTKSVPQDLAEEQLGPRVLRISEEFLRRV
jgi:hypothetical protein